MSNKPNIVFLLNDHQAYYNHEQLKNGKKIIRRNFDKLAKIGVEFPRAGSVCPLCGPARRSMLNGLYPHNHKEIRNDVNIPFDEDTYLDILSSAGYKNFYYGKWHAGPGTAYDHGCEGYSLPGYGYPYSTPDYLEYLKENDLPDPLVNIKFNKAEFKSKSLNIQNSYTTDTHLNNDYMAGILESPKECHEAFFLAHLACKKIKELAESNSDRPFHLRVDFWGPHQPYFPTQEFVDLYDPKDIPIHGNLYDDLSNKPDKYKRETVESISEDDRLIIPNPVPWEDWSEILALNYAQITLVDQAAGLILDSLNECGFMDDTMIVYSSDHGDALGCHGGHWDKRSYLPEEVMRIPMAISYPGHIEPNTKNNSLVSNLDIAPTILDAAGLEFKNKPDGKSLLKICANKNKEREDLMCESYGHLEKNIVIGRVLYWDKYKYVYNKGDMDELYDLDQDIYEMNNLIDDSNYYSLLNSMRKRLYQNQIDSNDLEELITI